LVFGLTLANDSAEGSYQLGVEFCAGAGHNFLKCLARRDAVVDYRVMGVNEPVVGISDCYNASLIRNIVSREALGESRAIPAFMVVGDNR